MAERDGFSFAEETPVFTTAELFAKPAGVEGVTYGPMLTRYAVIQQSVFSLLVAITVVYVLGLLGLVPRCVGATDSPCEVVERVGVPPYA